MRFIAHSTNRRTTFKIWQEVEPTVLKRLDERTQRMAKIIFQVKINVIRYTLIRNLIWNVFESNEEYSAKTDDI